jgi:hypothetical protein
MVVGHRFAQIRRLKAKLQIQLIFCLRHSLSNVTLEYHHLNKTPKSWACSEKFQQLITNAQSIEQEIKDFHKPCHERDPNELPTTHERDPNGVRMIPNKSIYSLIMQIGAIYNYNYVMSSSIISLIWIIYSVRI